MVERGIPDSQITVSGIPIREQFHDNVFAESDTPDGGARQRSVLIMAAAYGLRDVKKMIGHLSAIPNVRINVVCGRNAKLKETLECCYRSQDHIGIFGFVERIARLMGESSCIVTKAGGVTLSEAIQMNVPPLIYKPFPGQEKENARYLAGVGAACVVHSAGELAARVRELLFNERFSQNMKEKIRSLKKDNAADTIVQDVLRFIDRQSDVSAS
jgi:processive 1,2-diacylglycerol beta-glucosyltransferase